MRALIGLSLLLGGCGLAQPTIVDEAKSAVKEQLKDPESAKFDAVEKCKNSSVAFGKVNAKNGFGAYSGKANFLYARGHVYFEPDGSDLDQSEYFNALAKICESGTDRDLNDLERKVATALKVREQETNNAVDAALNAANAAEAAALEASRSAEQALHR